MKITNVLFNFLIVSLLFFAFSSCSNESIQEENEEVTVVEQSSRLENGGAIDEDSGGSGSGLESNSSSPVNIYRFYANGDHLYTDSLNEGYDANYNYEGVLATVNGIPFTYNITRWFNIGNGDRVITTNVSGHPAIAGSIRNNYVNEYGQLVSLPSDSNGNISGTNVPVTQASSNGAWRYEGALGSSTGNIPIFTYYNDNLKDHLYTSNFNELGNGANGYVYEGIMYL